MNVKFDIPNWNFSQFKVENPTGYFKLENWKNQVQIDRGRVCIHVTKIKTKYNVKEQVSLDKILI